MKRLLLVMSLALGIPLALAEIPAGASSVDRARPIEGTGALTHAAAQELALKANPGLAAAGREVHAMDAVIEQAQTWRNPEIAVLAEDERKETRTTTLQINQPIELGGKRAARVEAAERGRDAASADLAARQGELRATVSAAFYEVLASQERRRLAQTAFDLAQRVTGVVARRVTAGKVSPVEESKARVAEAGARVELRQAERDLANARQQLAATWGNSSPRYERVEGNIERLPELPALADLRQRLEQSPTLQRARLEIDRREALARVERSRQTPDLTLSLGAKRDETLGRNQAIVGVSMPLPLFDRNQGNLREALQRADIARDELDATNLRLQTALAQAYEALTTAGQEAEALQKEIVPAAERNVEATAKGFELGKFSFLDVLDAQRTLSQSRHQQLHALSEAHRAAAEIERILGVPIMAPAAPSR